MGPRLPELHHHRGGAGGRAHFLGRLPTADKPEAVAALVGLIRYTRRDPARPGHGAENQLVTAPLNPRIAPVADLVLADHARWEFAPAADEIKTHQRPAAPLRSRKPIGVIQEIYALLMAHYVVQAVIAEAARTVDLATTHLSFRAILRLIRAVLPEFQRDAPAEHPRLHQQRLADIAATHLPERPNRSNPRVVKQKMSNFRVKGPHHQHWPQPTKPFRDAVTLQN